MFCVESRPTAAARCAEPPALLDLAADRIDLWFAFFDDIRDPALLARYRGLLTDAERAQAGRFYFAKDRHRYLITRALVRTTLSRYVPLSPQQWSFHANRYGRPEIANDMAAARDISFNLSHTDSLIVLAVTGAAAVGVDTENTHTRAAALDVADRFFSPAEVAELRSLPAGRQHMRFFDYWTLKESYIKARGMGLSIPLDQFGFAFSSGDRVVSLSVDDRLDDIAAAWWLWHMQAREDYLVALCARRISGTRPRLTLRDIVPLQREVALECRELRVSE